MSGDSGSASGAFSSDDKSVLERHCRLEENLVTVDNDDDLDRVFEVDRCAAWIQEKQLESVTLQFPDSLLQFAPQVASRLQAKTSKKIAILGDTSYGECCVDEVAAEHVGADSVIHFGHTCLTPTQRLPVLYVFTVLPIDAQDLLQRIGAEFKSDSKVLVFYDVQFHHVLAQHPISNANVVLCPPTDVAASGVKCGRSVPENFKPDAVVYAGKNDRYETMLALTFPESKVYNYVPDSKLFHPSGPNVNRQLMKRFGLIEKTKDADRIGILVGTLGAASYADVIDRVRKTVRESGRKAYTFLVGKPNVAKLANFPEIDIFVLIACPENCVSGSVFDSVDYFKPVVSPYELDLALNKEREWGEWGEDGYQTDFRVLLPGSKFYRDFSADNEADFSLVTGKMRNTNRGGGGGEGEDEGSSRFALATQDTRVSVLHQDGGGEFLSQKSWQGLEQKLGQTPVTKAVEGQTGIPMEYKPIAE